METVHMTIAEAVAFLQEHARHYKYAGAEPIAAIGLYEDGVLHGAAILGRTDEAHGKLCHIYCDGAWHGYSLLYGACWRAYSALGFKAIDPR